MKYIYRIVDPKEWLDALTDGYLKPSKFYGRIHASYEPEFQYGKNGDLVLKIPYTDDWKIKQGDKEYLTLDHPLSIENIEIIKIIGNGKFSPFNFSNDEYVGLDTFSDDIRLEKGYNHNLQNHFPKIYNAVYRSLIDDSGLLVGMVRYNNEQWFVYRSKSGFKYTDDEFDIMRDLTEISPSLRRKFII